jgi:hypothetical protein
MGKIILLILSMLSVFVFLSAVITGKYLALFFLPIPAYFIASLVTNTESISIKKHKKALYYFIGTIIILSLISISKFI